MIRKTIMLRSAFFTHFLISAMAISIVFSFGSNVAVALESDCPEGTNWEQTFSVYTDGELIVFSTHSFPPSRTT